MKARNIIWQKRKKYGNITCAVDGIQFDSRREADYYKQLKLEKRAGLIKSFERQVTFDLFAWVPHDRRSSLENSQPENWAYRKFIGAHRVDFVITLPDGSKEVREVKGFSTAEWNLKRKIFEANYPDIKYKVVR